jgi:hypothetical protein
VGSTGKFFKRYTFYFLYIYLLFKIIFDLIILLAQTNTSTYISVVYRSDLTLYCNLSGNISFYFTENNFTTKQIITFDSVKYLSLNASVLIIKNLGKKTFNSQK